jgi:hypothetical protein
MSDFLVAITPARRHPGAGRLAQGAPRTKPHWQT